MSEGQRPPNHEGGGSAPEPGNSRVSPQQRAQAQAHEPNGNVATHPGQPPQQQPQGAAGEGGGRRRFRRQRRGGRGRGRGKTGDKPNVAAPLDAQGRIVDVENDQGDDGDEEGDAQGNVAQVSPPDGNAAESEGKPQQPPPPAEASEQQPQSPPPPMEAQAQVPAQPAGEEKPAEGLAPPPAEGSVAPAAASAEGQPPQQPPAPQQGQPQPGQQPQGQNPNQQQGRGHHNQRHQHRQGGQQGQQGNQPRQQQPQQQRREEPTTPVEGVLDVDHRGNGKLRNPNPLKSFLPQPDDCEVPKFLIEREKLRPGQIIAGQAARRNGKPQLVRVEKVEGLTPQAAAATTAFQNLTVIDPDDRLVMETTPKETLTRVIDLISPIGLGQRMLIVAPPKTGKTIMLQKICHAITINKPDAIQMVLLVDERPEEVTDFRRTVKAEVYASSADRPTEEHLHVAEMVLERAKRLVEAGKDVVILLDSITRLSRAYNKEVESSGRTLSGGVDSRALERPKRLFGAARNAEEGGSLTIIATALIDTGSRMDEVIFEEFKGTGNSEINLDRALAEKRVFPAINIQTSGTRKEEKLFSQHECEKVKKLRGALFALKPVESMERLIKSMNEFKSNAEFLDAI